MHIWPAGSYRGAVPRAVPLAMARAGTGVLPLPPPDLRATAALLNNRGQQGSLRQARAVSGAGPLLGRIYRERRDRKLHAPNQREGGLWSINPEGGGRRAALPGAKVAQRGPGGIGRSLKFCDTYEGLYSMTNQPPAPGGRAVQD